MFAFALIKTNIFKVAPEAKNLQISGVFQTHYIIYQLLVRKQLCSKCVVWVVGGSGAKRMILALSTSRLWWISLHFRALEVFFLSRKISDFKDEKEHPLRYSISSWNTFLEIHRSVCIFSVYLISHLEFWTLFCSKTICLFVVFQVFQKILFENLQQSSFTYSHTLSPNKQKKTTLDNIGGPF